MTQTRSLLLLLIGVFLVGTGANYAHESAWWLIAEIGGGLAVGTAWGTRP